MVRKNRGKFIGKQINLVAQRKSLIDRRRQLQNKRRSKKFFYFLSLILISMIAVVFSSIFLFKVSTIAVEGKSQYSKEKIIAASGLKKNDALVSINTRKVEDIILDQLPYLDDVSVQRQFFPTKVVIHVTDVSTACFIESNRNVYAASFGGKVLEIIKNKAPTLFTIVGLKLKKIEISELLVFQDTTEKEMYLSVVKNIGTYLLEKVSIVDVNKRYNILVIYDNRIVLNLGNPVDLDFKIRFAKKILETHIGENEYGILHLFSLEKNEANISNTSKAYFQATTSLPYNPENPI